MRFTLIFFLFTQLIIAQNINGIVFEADTNEPIENVTVFFKKGATGTTTDAFGKFNLNIKSKITETDSLQFSFVGYHAKTIALTQFKNSYTTVYLSKKLESLDQVFVNASTELKTDLHYKTLASLKSRVFAFGSQIIGSNIYVVSGNSSYLEDSGKRALEAVSNIANPTLADLIKEMRYNFYYEGYSDKLQIYDIQNDKWSVSDIKFRKRAYNNLSSYGNTLYSFGGIRLSINKKHEYLDDQIEVFDMASKDITIDHTNPHQAINFASFTYEDNIIIMGGSTELDKNGGKVYTNASHIYNITSGLWYELTKMTTPKETQGVIIENNIYLIGGDNGNKLKTIESYNVTSGTWTKEGDLFYEMEQPALASNEHLIYIYDKNKFLTYNTITKILKEYEIKLKLISPELHYYQNKIYIVGGFTENSHTTAASAKVYVIDLEEFENTKAVNSKSVN